MSWDPGGVCPTLTDSELGQFDEKPAHRLPGGGSGMDILGESDRG